MPESEFVFVTIKMPDDKTYDVPLSPKTFSTGRQGFYAQIPAMVYNGEMYGGQIQVWNKTKSDKKQKDQG